MPEGEAMLSLIGKTLLLEPRQRSPRNFGGMKTPFFAIVVSIASAACSLNAQAPPDAQLKKKIELANSPPSIDALDQTFRLFFQDEALDLRPEKKSKGPFRAIAALSDKYQSQKYDQILSDLREKESAIRTKARVVVETVRVDGKKELFTVAYTVIQKGDIILEVSKRLEFKFAKDDRLTQVYAIGIHFREIKLPKDATSKGGLEAPP